MATHVDDREQLEPGAGISSAPPPAEPVMVDHFAGYGEYYGFEERERWYFPDRKQWIEFKKMNEGDRGRFQSRTRPDVVMNQKSGEARIPFDQANERKELILTSCTDWHVVRRNAKTGQFELVPWTGNSPGGNLGQWLQTANPALVMELEKTIRKANPWMLQEMSVEQIDKEIADLEDLRRQAVEREERERTFQPAS